MLIAIQRLVCRCIHTLAGHTSAVTCLSVNGHYITRYRGYSILHTYIPPSNMHALTFFFSCFLTFFLWISRLSIYEFQCQLSASHILISSCSDDGSVRLWDLRDGRFIRTIADFNRQELVSPLSLSPFFFIFFVFPNFLLSFPSRACCSRIIG